MSTITWFGVADGVGGWRQYGVDPGKIARQMMLNADQLVSDKGFPNNHTAAQLLIGESYWKILYGKEVDAGSTTVCLAKIWPSTSQGVENLPEVAWKMESKPEEVDEFIMEVANIGDSGLLILRHGIAESGDGDEVPPDPEPRLRCVWATPFDRIGNNAPLQLAIVPPALYEKGVIMTDPFEASTYRLKLQARDIVIMGTDGVWDNVDAPIIEGLAVSCIKDGKLDLDALCEAVVAESLNGPKPDDITVAVCEIIG